jgi:SMC interacting uncharacterized protein involved in chromosome segregation
MLLAEALAAKKDALKEVNDLRERLAAAAVRYEDQEAASEDPTDLVAKLDHALDRLEGLTVRINKTNNEAQLAFDGRELSIMEAVAFRDRLTLEAKVRRGVVEAIEEGLETKGTPRATAYFQQTTRRSKDDVRKVVTIDFKAARDAADGLSERVRRLDIALQQQNWTVELVD